MDQLLKIAVTGPESTGKSALCEALAQHYHGHWIPEYARQFLETHGADYNFETLGAIARGHVQKLRKELPRQGLVFIDTDLINLKVWSEVVFGTCHPAIAENMSLEEEHKYLLSYPDIPWEDGPFREGPENREEIFDLHRREIAATHRPYEVVKGLGEARLQNAIAIVDRWRRDWGSF